MLFLRFMNGFFDRHDAGQKLAAELAGLKLDNPIVLALPRGGVPVGYEVARALHAPLDVWLVRKLGVPWHPELGAGAVAENGLVYINQAIVDDVGLSDEALADLVEDKQQEVAARALVLRGQRPPPELRGRTVILVDDGIATGGTVRAAIRSIRAQAPKSIVLAVPVGEPSTLHALRGEVDQLICLRAPPDLFAIGLWYADFSQLTDDEVVKLIERANHGLARDEHAAV